MIPPLTDAERTLAARRIPRPKNQRPPLTPGRVVYLLYYYPRSVWRDGYIWHYHLWRGRRELHASMERWPVPPTPVGEPLRLHYLTGKNYVPMTTVALLSAQTASGRPVVPVLHDDGSLDPSDVARIRRFFPAAEIVFRAEIEQALERVLPEARFPFLRKIRLGYIHLRKLTDIHTASAGWHLVSDSDVFFFRPPRQLLSLVAAPQACHMQDCMQSYGVPADFLEELAGCPLHPRVNVGLYHLDSRTIDWDFLEAATEAILAKHGFSYYLEQALTAMLLARAGAAPLDAGEYLVYPTPEQARAVACTALHYVDRAYLLLYRYGWRQIIARLPS